ncbi:hypothetical protein GGD83_004477 [Rhodoblastus sphagnicola]|uniref:hypothetical protein n=1 Tax=Rhodoblastus sphagnicola TaxID=333368 RepID=UPI0011B0BC7B|nr:hypothetical protein [Rhodoblastus sphagnicola]MBB4200648.1 hypothetical protein [Rhodoblastus sphagnicola]
MIRHGKAPFPMGRASDHPPDPDRAQCPARAGGLTIAATSKTTAILARQLPSGFRLLREQAAYFGITPNH